MADQAVSNVNKSSLVLSEKDLPEITHWKSGKEYDLILHVKQVSSSGDIKSSLATARFEILGAESPTGTHQIKESDFSTHQLRRLESKAQEY